jgi:hypothetical protein
VAQEAGEAAEAVTAMHNQAIVHLREQLQTESSLQLQRVKEELAAAAEAAAKSAQDVLETEAKALAQAEAEATRAKEAAAASEAAAADAAYRLETETATATRARAESASTAAALASIEEQHAELVVQYQQQAEQAEAALKRRSPLPIEEVEEALLSHQRLHSEQEARVQAEAQLHVAAREQLKVEAQARAQAEAEATRANAAVEQLRAELQRLAVDHKGNRTEATTERVEVLYARAQRRRAQHAFETLRVCRDKRVASRQRLFATRRKLERGCIRRTLSAWRHVSLMSLTNTSAEGGDAWFDELPSAHIGLVEAGSHGYMEPIYSEENIVLIQAATRGYLLRKDRRKQTKMSAARLKTFLQGCGLSRHWPAALRHNLTVAALLNLRDDQMKALGLTAADRRKLTKGLRLDRASMQRWVDSLEQSKSSADAGYAAATPRQTPSTITTPSPQETITSPVLDALSTEAEQLRSQLQALHLQEKIEQTRLSTRHAPRTDSIPEGTPPESASLAAIASNWTERSPVPTAIPTTASPRGLEHYQPAREFHLLLTAMAGGVDYQKFFHGQRSVSVFAGSVGELLQEISGALAQQGISMTGRAELLYADRRAGGDLVVLTNIADLPSRASVVLHPATQDEAEDLQEELPNSLLAFVAQSGEGDLKEEEEEELPSSLLSFNREHSPEPRRSPAAATPARLSQSPAVTPGSAVGLTPTRRVAKIDALIGELMLA